MGGTLVVSRADKLHEHYKKRFKELDFGDITITGRDKDGLNMLIREMEPNLVIMGANFYKCSTPYMVGELKQIFPKIKIAAVAIGEYPADLGMYFLINGAKGFVTSNDGTEQFYQGLKDIRNGKEFLSPAAQERLDIRSEFPNPAETITKRQLEVIRCVSNGFTDIEVANTLAISKRTVDNQKKIIFTKLNVRNEKELIRVALYRGWIKLEELIFFGRDYVLKPVPDTNKKFRGKE